MKTRCIRPASKKWLLSVLAVCGLFLYGAAQNGVAINTTGAAPDASAILDLSNSVSKGFLLPQIFSAPSISSPATGLIVYQTGGTPGIYCNIGTPAAPNWKPLSTSTSTGTVTSVGMTVPLGFSVSPSTITSSGTFAVTTSLSGLLYGTGSGFSQATVSAPLTFSGATLGITQAGSTTSGYLSSADWALFNAKQTALNGTGYVKQSGTTTSYSLINLSSSTDVTGNLQTSNGGTGVGTGTNPAVLVAPNQIFAGPATGSVSGLPTFRSVTAADIPSGNGNYIQNGTSQQTASFNINGVGTIGGSLVVNGPSTTSGLTNINSTSTSTNSNATNINTGTLSTGAVTIGGTKNTVAMPGLGTQGGIVYSSTTGGILAATAAGTSGYLLTSSGGSSAPTWTSPAAVTLGQSSTTILGNNSTTLTTTSTTYTLVPNLSQTVTVPSSTAGSTVMISTHGGMYVSGSSSSSYSATYVAIIIDGTASTTPAAYQEIDCVSGSTYYLVQGNWAMNLSTSLSAGSHTIQIYAKTSAGNSSTILSGSSTAFTFQQGALTVTVLKN